MKKAGLAVPYLREALRLESDLPLKNDLALKLEALGYALIDSGELEEVEEYLRRAITLKGARLVDDDYLYSQLLYSMQVNPACSADKIFYEACQWGGTLEARIPATQAEATNTNSGRRLNIGYVSTFFHNNRRDSFFRTPLAFP